MSRDISAEPPARRIAVTGSRGRLGQALMIALRASGDEVIAWSRPEYDLDDPTAAVRLVAGDRPDLIIHTAAWVDVDGCARDPQLALRRNAEATGELAHAAAAAEVDLLFISTNEVFDGKRTDGHGYAPADQPHPINPYGASKLAGEIASRTAFAAVGSSRFAIVRTAWLFGPPGDDFPAKILAASERAEAVGEPLRVVADEVGSPTYAPDVAAAIVALPIDGTASSIYHVVNDGSASRAEWAAEVLRLTGRTTQIEPISRSSWVRASTPPAWAVLTSSPLPGGGSLRHWREALAAHLSSLAPGRVAGP